MAIESGLVLITSDTRPKYAKDALAVLAAPEGSRYRFRYGSDYLPASVTHSIQRGDTLRGTRALIAFRPSVKGTTEREVIIPLRWVVIEQAKEIADFFIFEFRCAGYATVKGGSREVDRETLEELTKTYLDQENAHASDLAVFVGPSSLVDGTASGNQISWLYAAKRLALHKGFATTHFLRVSGISDSARLPVPSQDGFYVLPEGTYLNVVVDYFAPTFPDEDVHLAVDVDEEVVRVASGKRHELDSRYDSVTLVLHPKPAAGLTQAEVEIRTTSDNQKLVGTVVKLPVTVEPSARNKLYRFGSSFVGAFLVALPALLGDEMALWLRVAPAAAGAAVLAYGVHFVRQR